MVHILKNTFKFTDNEFTHAMSKDQRHGQENIIRAATYNVRQIKDKLFELEKTLVRKNE